MPEAFENFEFGSDEEMIAYLTEHSDDVDKLQIMVVNDLPIQGPAGQRVLLRNRCALLKLCSGKSTVVPTEVLQGLLDKGVLQRLQVPIELVPREAR